MAREIKEAEFLQQYRDNDIWCPVCKAKNERIGYHGLSWQDGCSAYQDCDCKVCNAKWTEIYKLKELIVTDEGNSNEVKK